MTKKQFIEDVKKEIRAIKKHAKPEEIKRLKLHMLNPLDPANCIYGQLTRNCRNKRAVELISKCCKRVVSQAVCYVDRTYSDISHNINGTNPKKITDDPNDMDFTSALEQYINIAHPKHLNIISYLKGETNKLEL
jgi:hypothetical protein